MPERIALVTDSTCDLTPIQRVEAGITVVPLSVFFGEDEYRDGVDLAPEQFFSLLKTSPQWPTTAQPSIGQFHTAFSALQQQGFTHILGIFISQKLSGTAGAAGAAAKMLPDLTVEIIDSKTISLGLGFLALHARDLINQGLSFADLVAKIQAQIPRSLIYFSVESLDALRRGGRISKVAAFFGKHLNLRPVLALSGDKGEIELVETVHSHAASMEAVGRHIREYAEQKGIGLGVGVVHAAMPWIQKEWLDRLQTMKLDLKRLCTVQIGSVIGTHLGADGWGVVLS